MFKILLTTLFVSAFFILFFEPKWNLKNKIVRNTNEEATTTGGFIEDTYRGPFVDHFIPPTYGDIGTFTSYSSIPENNWLHGFPHKKAK